MASQGNACANVALDVKLAGSAEGKSADSLHTARKLDGVAAGGSFDTVRPLKINLAGEIEGAGDGDGRRIRGALHGERVIEDYGLLITGGIDEGQRA